MPAPSAAAVITSSDRVKPCCATTWPDEVMSRVSRAADSVEERLRAGASTQGSSARIRPAVPPHRASPAGRGRHSRPARPRPPAPGRPAPGAASMEPASARRCTNAGGAAPGAARCAAEPSDEAPGERRDRAAVDPVHELLGDDQPVAGGDDQRPAHARHPGDPVERRLGRGHRQPLQPAAGRARRPLRQRAPTRAIGSDGSRAASSIVSRRRRRPGRSARRATRSRCVCQLPEPEQPGGARRLAATRPASCGGHPSPRRAPSGAGQRAAETEPVGVDQQRAPRRHRSNRRTASPSRTAPRDRRGWAAAAAGGGCLQPRARRRRRHPPRPAPARSHRPRAAPHAGERLCDRWCRRGRPRRRAGGARAPPPRRRRGNRGTRCPCSAPVRIGSRRSASAQASKAPARSPWSLRIRASRSCASARPGIADQPAARHLVRRVELPAAAQRLAQLEEHEARRLLGERGPSGRGCRQSR